MFSQMNLKLNVFLITKIDDRNLYILTGVDLMVSGILY